MNQAVVRVLKLPVVIFILYCCVTVIQYITVSGGTCNMLSVFWKFTGEICFIKVSANDNNRDRTLLFCVSDLISEFL